eukprot:6470916-Amphidinium_carterae.1
MVPDTEVARHGHLEDSDGIWDSRLKEPHRSRTTTKDTLRVDRGRKEQQSCLPSWNKPTGKERCIFKEVECDSEYCANWAQPFLQDAVECPPHVAIEQWLGLRNLAALFFYMRKPKNWTGYKFSNDMIKSAPCAMGVAHGPHHGVTYYLGLDA